MPKPSLSWKIALAALLTGIFFAVANIRLGYGSLANLCFALAVLCDLIVVVFAILWVYGKGWEAQPGQQQQMQGRPPIPGAPQMQIRPMQPQQGVMPGAATPSTSGAVPTSKSEPPAH